MWSDAQTNVSSANGTVIRAENFPRWRVGYTNCPVQRGSCTACMTREVAWDLFST